MSYEKKPLKAIAGLWRSKSGSGYSGKLDNQFDFSSLRPGQKVLLFKNDRKKNEKQPDLRLMIEVEPEEARGQHREERAPTASNNGSYDEDVPF